MAMNPVKLMQIKATIAGVERRHPNLRKFFEAVGREKLISELLKNKDTLL